MSSNIDHNIVTIKNRKGLSAQLSDHGARIVSLKVPLDHAHLDVIKTNTQNDQYIDSLQYAGATIGPFANRIDQSAYDIEGHQFTFEPNEGGNLLHSGNQGFHARTWDIKEQADDIVVFELNSLPEQESSYKVYVTFMVTDDNSLLIQFEAKVDQKMHINLTSHGFFNLSHLKDLSAHRFQIFADAITVINEEQIPTGEYLNLEDTLFDLRASRQIEHDLYDHNYVLTKEKGLMTLAAIAKATDTGLEMHCYTTQPGLQFFTRRGDAFCFETQHFPDTPHHPHFPSTLLSPDSVYKEQCLYRFKHTDNVFLPFGPK